MPGFSFQATVQGQRPPDSAHHLRALNRLSHSDRYSHHPIMDELTVRFYWTGYPGYPVHVWKSAAAALLLEGTVHHPHERLIQKLIDPAIPEVERFQRSIRQLSDFSRSVDGDFVFVYISRQSPHQLVVATDFLGRLPVYWSFVNGQIVVAREPKFIAAASQTAQPDRTGIAQLLLFGFPWGERTLIEGMGRLPAGAVLSWEGDAKPPLVRSHFECSFESVPQQGPIDECAESLAREFIGATERRIQTLGDRPIVLSLSGGLDSRAVAAALHRSGASIQTCTLTLGRQYAESEAEVARRIAGIYGQPHTIVRLSRPSNKTMEDHVVRTDGLNSAALAYADEYLTHIVNEIGSNAALFTGEGGDLVLPPRRPHQTLSDTPELIDLIRSRSAAFPPQQISMLLNLPADHLRTQLSELIDSYPEDDRRDRYYHLMWEFQRQLYFYGEDRNRQYLWVEAPFYGRPFFDHALCAPFEWKRFRKLQIAFARALDHSLVEVPYSNTGLIPGSTPDRFRQRMREVVKGRRSLEKLFRRLRPEPRRAGSIPDQLRRDIRNLIEDTALVGDLFNRDLIRRVARGNLEGKRGWLLWTVLRYLKSLNDLG